MVVKLIKKKNSQEVQYKSILLMGCHPELSKRYQFNLTNNKNGKLVNV